MKLKNESNVVYFASLFICIAFGAAGIYLFLKYGLSVILPIVIGWAVAMVISPLAQKLSGKNESRKKAISVILFVILIFFVVLFIVFAINRLASEAHRLLDRLADDSAKVYELIGGALDFAQSFTEHIPFLRELTGGEDVFGIRDRIDGAIESVITGLVTRLSQYLPKFLGSIVTAFPSFLLFILVTLISGFYFCMDLEGIHRGIKSALPLWLSKKLTKIKNRLQFTAACYLRAYILLLIMTFCELFIAFSILGIDYALLLSAVIAIIDILPVFGVGSVLIPWSVVLLISKNYYLGIGLLIVYGCVAVVRQIAEPKIVSGSLGTHPLLTLAFMYAGFKLFGIFGMLLGPAAALATKSLLFPSDEGQKKRIQ